MLSLYELWAPWRSTAALAAMAAAAALLLFLPSAAMPASVTYSNSGCTSFVVSGTPANQTITCVGGSAVPVCAPTANPPQPSAGQGTTISANCSNQPLANSYVWTGAACVGLTGPTCAVTGKTRRTSITYTVMASNSTGPGVPASITITWQ